MPETLGWRARFRAALVARLLQAVLALLGASTRLRTVAGDEVLATFHAERRPALFVFWHDRMLIGSYFMARRFQARGYPMTVLNSPSRDGELGSRVVRYFGGESVRGSTSRGGTRALRGLLRSAARGNGLMLMPDGPRGPRHRVKPGIVAIAQLAGIPIVPLSWAAARSWHLGSWDRMEIPRPFTRVCVAAGEPIVVPRRLDEEDFARYAAAVESTLEDLEELARGRLGRG